jgi:hypothetical protein
MGLSMARGSREKWAVSRSVVGAVHCPRFAKERPGLYWAGSLFCMTAMRGVAIRGRVLRGRSPLPAHVFPANRSAGGAVLDEFQGPEDAMAADFADDGVLLGKTVEARLEVVPAKVLGQAFPDSRRGARRNRWPRLSEVGGRHPHRPDRRAGLSYQTGHA